MVGLATRLLIARRAAEALKAQGDPRSSTIEANAKWYYLGALGPALGDFVPTTPYRAIWKQVLRMAVGDVSVVDGVRTGTPGAVPVLRTFDQFLGQMTKLVADHDFNGLKDLRDSGQLDAISETSRDLSAIVAQFSDRKRLEFIGRQMGSLGQPAILNRSEKRPFSSWTGRDWLHWKHPGRFATSLRTRAAKSGDPRFIAYAHGWTVAYSALVCGSGFMGSLVGGPHRNHWWRSRFVGNFVDTWTWGFYGAKASMSPGDEPAPPYDAWPGLCNARLNEMVDVTGGLDVEETARRVVTDQALPHVLPDEFVAFWLEAWNTAYGDPQEPLFTAPRLQEAYLLLWITLWFQTSGDVIGCNRLPGDPPAACDGETPPDWRDPTQIDPSTNRPYAAPPPNAKHDPDEAEVVCGIIVALAGVACLFLGGAAVGIPALAGGIGLIVDGEENLNWDELECHLYWLRVYLSNGLSVLHGLAVYAGLMHPYPAEFLVDGNVVAFNGGQVSYLSAASVCKSRILDGVHPPWNSAMSPWTEYPANGLEAPPTNVWDRAGLWPSAIVDDAHANPATEDLARTPAKWPGGIHGSFGPAVPAALQLMRSDGLLPDWNLDGDRGLGWLTWELAGPYSVPVDALPEKP